MHTKCDTNVSKHVFLFPHHSQRFPHHSQRCLSGPDGPSHEATLCLPHNLLSNLSVDTRSMHLTRPLLAQGIDLILRDIDGPLQRQQLVLTASHLGVLLVNHHVQQGNAVLHHELFFTVGLSTVEHLLEQLFLLCHYSKPLTHQLPSSMETLAITGIENRFANRRKVFFQTTARRRTRRSGLHQRCTVLEIHLPLLSRILIVSSVTNAECCEPTLVICSATFDQPSSPILCLDILTRTSVQSVVYICSMCQNLWQ